MDGEEEDEDEKDAVGDVSCDSCWIAAGRCPAWPVRDWAADLPQIMSQEAQCLVAKTEVRWMPLVLVQEAGFVPKVEGPQQARRVARKKFTVSYQQSLFDADL